MDPKMEDFWDLGTLQPEAMMAGCTGRCYKVIPCPARKPAPQTAAAPTDGTGRSGGRHAGCRKKCSRTSVEAPDNADRMLSAVPLPAMLGLPDEVLAIVFGFCDARARMMAIPAVSRRWRTISQHHTRNVDLAWAVRWMPHHCHPPNTPPPSGEYPDPQHRRHCAITDAGIAGLVCRFPNLQCLRLAFCNNVTVGGLEAIAAGCPNLRHLNLVYCRNVTDGGLEAVGAGCPNLQHLRLVYCANLTDRGLEAVAAGCPNLKHLDLSCSENVITDAGLGAVAARCPHLQSLHLDLGSKVTDGGLEAVAAGCPNLEHLDLSVCENVTDGGLEAVAAGCPNLQHLNVSYCNT